MQIEHVAIWTKNLDELKAFYETYFQAKASKKYVNADKDFESYFLTFSSGARLELMRMPTIPESRNNIETQFTGYIHIAFSVGSKENVDTLTERLHQDHHPIVGETRYTGDG